MPWVRREAFPLGFPWDRGELSFTTPATIRITASRTPHDVRIAASRRGEELCVDQSGAITLRSLTYQVRLLWGRWPLRCDYFEGVYRSGCLHLKLLTNEVRARKCSNFQPVAGIRIRILRIRIFLDLPDPHPDPLVTSTDPDSSIIKNSLENLDFYYFLISLWLLRVMYQCSESGSYVFGPTVSASGSVLKCHGSTTLVPTSSCDHWDCLTNQVR